MAAAPLPAAVFSSGPATVCAPPAARPVPKGLFTAGFLARLAYEKHVLGRRAPYRPGAGRRRVRRGPGHAVRGAEADRAADRAVGGGDRRARPDRRARARRRNQLAGVRRRRRQGRPPVVAMGLRHRRHHRVRDGHLPLRPVAAGQLGIDREQAALEAAAAWSSPRTSTRPTSRWPSSRRDPLWCFAHIRRYFLRAGPRTPRRSATGPTRGPSGSQCCTGRTTPSRPPCRAPRPTRTPRRWQRAFTDIDAHRILQARDAAKGLLHPAAAKVIATLNHEWTGCPPPGPAPAAAGQQHRRARPAHPGDRPQELLRLRRPMGRPPGRRI